MFGAVTVQTVPVTAHGTPLPPTPQRATILVPKASSRTAFTPPSAQPSVPLFAFSPAQPGTQQHDQASDPGFTASSVQETVLAQACTAAGKQWDPETGECLSGGKKITPAVAGVVGLLAGALIGYLIAR